MKLITNIIFYFHLSPPPPAIERHDVLPELRCKHYEINISGRQSEEQLQQYVLDTVTYIKTVRDFCDMEKEWTDQRTSEIRKMSSIKSCADGRCKREKELGAVVKNTLEGLEKLQPFLDAMERLAVTSLSVFTEEIFQLKGASAKVYSVISTARAVSPWLVLFKRDEKAFFLPRLDNVEVLGLQLEQYKTVTQQLCERMRLNMTGTRTFTSDHLSQLSKIRMDESFRMTFLFNGKAQEFLDIYTECRTRMSRFLSDLKVTEDKLNKLETGSRISTVTGTSVGVAGGALSITGLALVPVSGGLSLALTFTGIGLGVLSGAARVVTSINKMAKKKKHGKKANNIFESFKEDVDKVLDCLDQTGRSQRPAPHVDEGNILFGAVEVIVTTGASVKGVKDMVQKGQALNAMNSVRTGKSLVCMGLKEARVAQKIPIGDIVKLSSQVISKVVRVGTVAMNVLFIGIDLKTIYDECKNLDKGKKSKASELIFSRSALWRSETEAWEKIHDSLCKGKETIERNVEILDQPFYH
uniref:Uncharacterized protein n=1 Tax=Pygocentrus nattereri TaxID=42514 RepID=A0AAR2IVT6_PYGNA